MQLNMLGWSLNQYCLSKIWFRTHSVDLRVLDLTKITSHIKSWLYADMLLKPEETRLPGAVPQSLFLLLIVLSCIMFLKVVFHFQKKMRSSSFKKIDVVFHFKNIIVFTFNCFWLHYFVLGRLPFSKKIKVVFL